MGASFRCPGCATLCMLDSYGKEADFATGRPRGQFYHTCSPDLSQILIQADVTSIRHVRRRCCHLSTLHVPSLPTIEVHLRRVDTLPRAWGAECRAGCGSISGVL